MKHLLLNVCGIALITMIHANSTIHDINTPPLTPSIKSESPKPLPRKSGRAAPKPRIRWYRKDTFNSHAPRIIQEPFTTSVIIPCYYKHAHLIYALLELYTQQTVLPDEIVIALSECDLVPSETIAHLENARWPFRTTVILVPEKQFAGQNRNTACDHATGDVFICQDADDIPHLQRVEIIRHFFHHYPVQHLLHEWIDVEEHATHQFPEYNDLEQISFAYHRPFKELWQHAAFTNGNNAITRQVFEKIRWTSAARGQDTIFNREVYDTFKHCIAIQAKLLGYRQFLSSTQVSDTTVLTPGISGTNHAHYAQIYKTTMIRLEAFKQGA